MSLDKVRAWIAKSGRLDITKDRSQRELAILDKVCRIALDLDGVVAHQGAKVGKGGEQYDLSFGRMLPNRKTPVIFCGVLFRPQGQEWFRKSDPPEADAVRLYLRISEAGTNRSPWSFLAQPDDSLKHDGDWRYLEIPDRVDIEGEELLDLIEDAYFEVVGI
jgi:hypothetical protein